MFNDILNKHSDDKEPYDSDYPKRLNTAVKQVLMAVRASAYQRGNINQKLRAIIKDLADYRIEKDLNVD